MGTYFLSEVLCEDGLRFGGFAVVGADLCE